MTTAVIANDAKVMHNTYGKSEAKWLTLCKLTPINKMPFNVIYTPNLMALMLQTIRWDSSEAGM